MKRRGWIQKPPGYPRMKRGAPCRHCGSPSTGNPCWNGIAINKKVRADDGRMMSTWTGDPPCVVIVDMSPPFVPTADMRRKNWIIAVCVAIVMVVVLGFAAVNLIKAP